MGDFSVEWGLLIVFALLVWYWHGAMRVRECAIAAARAMCGRMGMPLLDDTVFLTTLRLKRDSAGRLRLRRFYQFEYAPHPGVREQGMVILLGDRVETVLVQESQSGMLQ